MDARTEGSGGTRHAETPSLDARIRRGLYCLHCFAPLPDDHARTVQCAGCGATNLHSDRQSYWTRAPEARRRERGYKLGVVLITAVLQVSVFAAGGIGTGQGYVFALPLLVGVILWEAASGVTRRQRYVDPRYIWIGIPALLALFGFLGFAFALIDGSGHGNSAISAAALFVLGVVGAFGARLGRSALEGMQRGHMRWLSTRILRRGRELGIECE